MQNNSTQIDLVGIEKQSCYLAQGIIFATDEKEIEYRFSLTVLGKTQEAVNRYLEYVQSTEFFHIDWMISRMGENADTDASPPLPVMVTSDSQWFEGIIQAEILPIESDDHEVVSEKQCLKKRETSEVIFNKQVDEDVRFWVDSGSIQLTTTHGSFLMNVGRGKAKPLHGFKSRVHVFVEGLEIGDNCFYYKTSSS
ncbi:MAG: hypothetical protein KDE50_02040 [Caldilineaceae bacterium]|nr:hypothetical protein [Caldilineaceae bacterium]